jgi:uncharacterized protein with NAD-binding domain and iron-sulfur cluster
MARQRIAVLGGGLGALSTVFHLTDQPDWVARYDITLYQQGWRLGGKCASGRDLRDGYGHRILEHGLHLFGGFYNYSFAMLRRCYETLGRPEGHPNRTVWDAFTGLDAIALMDRDKNANGDTVFDPWWINFEPAPGLPGEGFEPPTVTAMMQSLIRMVGVATGTVAHHQHHAKPDDGGFLQQALQMVEGLVLRIADDVADDLIHDLIAHIEAYAASTAAKAGDGVPAKAIERMLMTVYLVQTVLWGMVEDDVLDNGFDPLDRYELKDWIRRHGLEVAKHYKRDVPDPKAAAEALANSPIVRCSYDYVFGYKDGDPGQPGQGAGTALRGFLRLAAGFRGHLFYTMRGGMGDVVIAPLYQELARRGVKFEFFSRVERLRPGEGDLIEAIEIGVQARTGPDPYQPLIDVPLAGWSAEAPLPCWPGEPRWDQLEDGQKLKAEGIDFEAPWSPVLETRTLRAGVDFDQIVLGIPVGELKRVCADLPAVKPKWQAMFDALGITRTIALQLWFRRTNEDLGCDYPGRTLTGAAQPLSCWADMSHLLSRETWQAHERPQSIAYFCGQMRGPATQDAAEAQAATDLAATLSRSWLMAEAATLWRAAGSGDIGIDPVVLFDPEDRAPDRRFEAQYWRANTTPSEMYVQYLPGSLPARLRAEESGFGNLFLCGDWTRNGLNAGAAEAAVMSGVICARAIWGDHSVIAAEVDILA